MRLQLKIFSIATPLIALIASVAFAGSKDAAPHTLNGGVVSIHQVSGDVGTIIPFSGALGVVRATGNTNEYFACAVGYFVGHPANAPRIFCSARDAVGNVASCVTWSTNLAQVLATVNPDSYITVHATRTAPYSNVNMNCTSIEVTNASYLSTKRE
jgi:hypothetical protein